MTSQRSPYKSYTKEFKAEAVRLMQSAERPASETARQLGIRRNQLYKWQSQLAIKGEQAFGGICADQGACAFRRTHSSG